MGIVPLKTDKVELYGAAGEGAEKASEVDPVSVGL